MNHGTGIHTAVILEQVQLPYIGMGAHKADAMVWMARHSRTTRAKGWEDIHERCTRLLLKKKSTMLRPLAFLWRLDKMTLSRCSALRVLRLESNF